MLDPSVEALKILILMYLQKHLLGGGFFSVKLQV